jgi:hypothetical protein
LVLVFGANEKEDMNKKERAKYTDEPMELGEEVENFLPPPDKLVLRSCYGQSLSE